MTNPASNAPSSLRRSVVLGVRVVSEPFEKVLASVVGVLESPVREAVYLCPTGVHGVIEAQKDPDFRRILNGAVFNVADGMPLVRVSQLQGYPKAERAFGPDVMWALLGRSVALGTSHFFYGGKEGVGETLAEISKEAFPGLRVAGTYCPPFRPLNPDEETEIVELINGSGADVVWVGLSTPKQERWVAAFRERLDVKLLCTVGAAFDYHTGSITVAPKWVKVVSLEWLFRLFQEPRRLWRRYFEIVPKFLFLILLQATGLRRYPVE